MIISQLTWLHAIFVDIWTTEEIVEDWKLAILIRLFKNKGDKTQCYHYRSITLLLVVASKLFTRVTLNRVQGLIDRQILETQTGFRTNRSTVDQIFTLKMAMEKSREFDRPMFMCFIDIQKVYDSVNRDLLWKICRQYGLTEKTVCMVKLVHQNSRAQVRVEGELSDSFEIETGVMFSHGSNGFFQSTREKYVNFDVLTLMYADDLVVLCNTLDDVEKFIKSFEKITQQYGLTMSVKKTYVMSLQHFQVDQPLISFEIRNQTIQTTDSLTYLGCIISRDQRSEPDLQLRLSKAASACNMLRCVVWYRKTISIEAKLRICRA